MPSQMDLFSKPEPEKREETPTLVPSVDETKHDIMDIQCPVCGSFSVQPSVNAAHQGEYYCMSGKHPDTDYFIP